MQVSLRRLSVIEAAYQGFLKSVYHYHCSLICFRRPSCLMEKVCLSLFLSSVFLSSGKTFLKPTTKNIIACTEFLVSGAWCSYRAFRHQDQVKIFECLNVYLDIIIVKKGFYAMYILYFSYHNDIKEMERNVLLRGDQNRVYNRIKENVWKMHKY